MYRRITLFVSVLYLSTSLQLLPVSAVENGTDARNDPNAVMIDGGYSGFLYSPRIVLTVAHDLEYGRKKETARIVGFPGEVGVIGGIANDNFSVSEKIFWAPNYQSRTVTNWSRIDDFAVIVLLRPMVVKNKVKIATETDIQKYALNKTPIQMIGYGRQQDRRLPTQLGSIKVFPNQLTSRILSDEESNYIKRGLPPGVIFTSDINFEQIPSKASVCDGDSGAGWFVEEDGFRNYIGAASSGIGGPNCGKDGFWDPNGSLASVSAAYKFMDLIAEAEKYVADNPYVEPKSKSAGLNNKITITCVKGKTTKKVSGITPKCPAGFKKV